MKRAFLFLLLIIALLVSKNPLACGNNTTKTTLSGKITDKKTGQSIPGATVYLPEFQSGAMSDSAGHYFIDNLHPAKVVILGGDDVVSAEVASQLAR